MHNLYNFVAIAILISICNYQSSMVAEASIFQKCAGLKNTLINKLPEKFVTKTKELVADIDPKSKSMRKQFA